ncbi:MAG TPA: hypothetical protein VLM76_15660 [Patescibacteria group bacterium]|nr:hypothetical protein [Patescibacteria group bacterium]
MPITTLDGIVAGNRPPDEFLKLGAGTQVIGRPYSTAYAPGVPGAMAAPAGGIQGLGLLTKPGQIPFVNPDGGMWSYLSRLSAECINAGSLWLCDRLWENSGNSATLTTAQNHFVAISWISVASPTVVTTAAHGQAAGTFVVHIAGSNSTPSINGTWTATWVSATTFTIPVNVTDAGNTGEVTIAIPPRDRLGTAVGTTGAPAGYGAGVQIAYEVSTVMGAGTPTLTADYINSTGVLRTTPVITLAATMIAGAFIILPLAAGDVGVRALRSHIKNATQTSGTYHMILFRTIARIGVPMPGVNFTQDAITAGFPRLYDNSVPFLVWVPNSTVAPTALSGNIVIAQG